MRSIAEIINALPSETDNTTSELIVRPQNGGKMHSWKRKVQLAQLHAEDSIIKRCSATGRALPNLFDSDTTEDTEIVVEELMEDQSSSYSTMQGSDSSLVLQFGNSLSAIQDTVSSTVNNLLKDRDLLLADECTHTGSVSVSNQQQRDIQTQVQLLAQGQLGSQRSKVLRITQDREEFRRFKQEFRQMGLLTTPARALLNEKIDATAFRTAKRQSRYQTM